MDGCVKTLLLCLMVILERRSSAAALQCVRVNFCTNATVLRTRVACHSCTISMLRSCPAGFRQTPGSGARDCTFHIRTSSLRLHVPGCSFECYQEVEVKSCCPGFWGPDCAAECPERADTPCSGHGACSDGLGGTGVCSCQQPGFVGTSCEDCTPGRYGPTCSSECSCVHGLCDSGIAGSGQCTCFSGYSGPTCDRERPECAALGCLQNSRCVEEAATGLLRCQCLHGYQKSGQQCLPIDPCLQNVCHAHAACVHTGPGQHTCTCNHGYSGDGRVCVAVDPCQSQQGGCSVASQRCVYDGPGTAHCECLPGFERVPDGSCRLEEACQPHTCHRNADCTTVGPATPRCTCRQGYVGNGKVCYGNIVERLQELNTEPGGAWSGQLSAAISLFAGSVSWPLQNLGPFTAFVPINKAFRGTPVKTLTADPSSARYLCQLHLVAGVMTLDTLKKSDQFYTLTGKSAEVDASGGDLETRIRLHGSRKKGAIVQAGIMASNGMIHLINKLMDSVAPIVQSDAQENMMKIISDYGKFSTLKPLLQKADLEAMLDLPGPITVFAPISSAFDLMAEGHLTYLRTAEGHAKLVELLRNHVITSAALDVFNIVSTPSVVSLANQVLTINVTDNGQILVGGAAVLEAAVEAKNGRLYVMDGVLVPASIRPLLPHRCDVTESRIIKVGSSSICWSPGSRQVSPPAPPASATTSAVLL
uniref:Stabilin 2 n=1 Tax=Tetraodon nigroviridis TaxID=99883 RepID=H3CCR8_TETNG